ncbi:hypothetical protein HHK36_021553 [Tetracentron sinense]|uniref:Auxin-responsive protein n=1 Tax=Tetracentron sinense TaxID=13715 RepID=A0A834YRS0_TETSI|nr:hypothetical protein HHK36_021553 [Tetracentron sinense]
MSTETEKPSPESDTELTLGLPGESQKTIPKRGYSETVDLNLRTSISESRGKDQSEIEIYGAGKPSYEKTQVVGWPPVRSTMKNALKSCRYMKVAIDGAPYLRKVNLEVYRSYQELLSALEEMFTCFTICNYLKESKLMDRGKGTEYVATYEDKDGD